MDFIQDERDAWGTSGEQSGGSAASMLDPSPAYHMRSSGGEGVKDDLEMASTAVGDGYDGVEVDADPGPEPDDVSTFSGDGEGEKGEVEARKEGGEEEEQAEEVASGDEGEDDGDDEADDDDGDLDSPPRLPKRTTHGAVVGKSSARQAKMANVTPADGHGSSQASSSALTGGRQKRKRSEGEEGVQASPSRKSDGRKRKYPPGVRIIFDEDDPDGAAARAELRKAVDDDKALKQALKPKRLTMAALMKLQQALAEKVAAVDDKASVVVELRKRVSALEDAMA
ncbi:hypothetical protein LTR53_001006 [Teratosphaeriaceae sp. CCFEE 6253]|nr:hypothetical protein LTR53_001006 [Teratosphaeriaceae sp. CCFEE 6253]